MKLAVFGGSGLIGNKVVDLLSGRPRSSGGVAVDGCQRLDRRGAGRGAGSADVVVDVVNSPSFADEAVMEFFSTSTSNLAAAEKTAGVGHYVVLSIVGRGRAAGQRLHAGQGRAGEDDRRLRHPLLGGARHAVRRVRRGDHRVVVVGDEVRVPDGLIQLIAADDVAAEVARVAVGPPWAAS